MQCLPSTCLTRLLFAACLVAASVPLSAQTPSRDSPSAQEACTTPECNQCDSAGFTSASNSCSIPVHNVTLTIRERYTYRGANEGHDGAGNLLRSAGVGIGDICNLSNGTCSKQDSGCGFFTPGWALHCEGHSTNVACQSWEICTGEWSGSATSTWVPTSQSPLARVKSFQPVDCDCTSSTSGFTGLAEAAAMNGQLGSYSLRSMEQCVSDAGCVFNRGWEGTQTVRQGIRCGELLSNGECRPDPVINVTSQVRQIFVGNPNFIN